MKVRDCCLGWDITDYGMGENNFLPHYDSRWQPDYEREIPQSVRKNCRFLKEGQYSPNHFHWYKMEDIINRGGGNVLIRVYNSKPNSSMDYERDVTVHTDGRTYIVPASTQIRLTPGESIFVP